MKKKILSLALALVLTFALAITAFAANTKTLKTNDGKNLTISNVNSEAKVSLTEIAKWITLSKEELAFMKDYYGDTLTAFYCDAPVTVNAKEGVAGMSWKWDNSVKEGSVSNTFKKDTSVNYDWFTGSLKLTAPGRYLISVNSHRTGAYPYYIVIGGDAPAKSDTEKTPVQKPAPSKPADKDTVKVAGENRTPGQIQTLRSGDYLYTVSYGDTLYDLSERFYGNGNLWKELQKANQKYLNDAKDNIIFVGFNLVIPAELDGVRVNIG